MKRIDLKLLNERAISDMSKFAGRPVEVYRSIDTSLTGRYFGDNKETPAYVEVICFGYDIGKSTMFLRYPNSEVYVEIYGGSGSSRGSMQHWSGRNILEEETHGFVYQGKLQPSELQLKKHDNFAMINFDSKYSGEFNFLERVGMFGYDDYPGEVYRSFGQRNIDDMLGRKYIPIPAKRRIESAFKTEDGNIIIVDASAFNFSYGGLRCHYGNTKDGMNVGVISNFQRYRDGGTTLFDLEVNGVVHSYYAPASLGNTDKKPKLDDKVMVKLSEEDITFWVEQLNIDLVVEVDNGK